MKKKRRSILQMCRKGVILHLEYGKYPGLVRWVSG